MEIRNEYFSAFIPERLVPAVERETERLEREEIVARIWSRDWKVWKNEDREISDRLGWLDVPGLKSDALSLYEAFARTIREENISRILLLGMGGSSLAAEAFNRTMAAAPGYPGLTVVDTTVPETIMETLAGIDFEKTLFIVSSKSGTTAESNALLCFFYGRALEKLGPAGAGRRFVAITDPGTPLETAAGRLGFRKTFHGRKDVGGRFSALTAFGLLPAACSGAGLELILNAAGRAAAACRQEKTRLNPGAQLGLLLGVAFEKGIDKLTVTCPPGLKPVFDWLEQLLAESTGKEGKGILPVYGPLQRTEASSGSDRFHVDLQPAAGEHQRPGTKPAQAGDQPRLVFQTGHPHDLGGLLFIWEMAVAIAGHIMGINPFDQPDVELTKRKTREFMESAAGRSAAEQGREPAADGRDLALFLNQAKSGDYVAIQAFLSPADGTAEVLDDFAAAVVSKSGLPVTVGFGPRFLHSTGQLHKGGPNNGLFIQLVSDYYAPLEIPEIPGLARPALSFDSLIRAQSWGDWTALREKKRRTIRLHTAGPDRSHLSGLIDRIFL